MRVKALILGYLQLPYPSTLFLLVLLQRPLLQHLNSTMRHMSAEDKGLRRETSDNQ